MRREQTSLASQGDVSIDMLLAMGGGENNRYVPLFVVHEVDQSCPQAVTMGIIDKYGYIKPILY